MRSTFSVKSYLEQPTEATVKKTGYVYTLLKEVQAGSEPRIIIKVARVVNLKLVFTH